MSLETGKQRLNKAGSQKMDIPGGDEVLGAIALGNIAPGEKYVKLDGRRFNHTDTGLASQLGALTGNQPFGLFYAAGALGTYITSGTGFTLFKFDGTTFTPVYVNLDTLFENDGDYGNFSTFDYDATNNIFIGISANATTVRVVKSVDGLVTFSEIAYFAAKSVYGGTVKVLSNGSWIIYPGQSGDNKIYYSTDNGVTWTSVTNPYGFGNTGGIGGVCMAEGGGKVMIVLGNDTPVLYAAIGGLGTWTQITDFGTVSGESSWGSIAYHGGSFIIGDIGVGLLATIDATTLAIALGTVDGVYATGTATFSGNPADGDVLTCASKTYRFKNTLAAANDVLIGVDLATTLGNLQAAVNAAAGIGTTYGTGTTINIHASCSCSATVATFTSKKASTGANSKNLTKTSTVITVSGTTLTGGVNGKNVYSLRYNDTTSKYLALIVDGSNGAGSIYKIASSASALSGYTKTTMTNITNVLGIQVDATGIVYLAGKRTNGSTVQSPAILKVDSALANPVFTDMAIQFGALPDFTHFQNTSNGLYPLNGPIYAWARLQE